MISPVRTDAFAHGVDRTSFENTRKWLNDVRSERGEDVVIILVGNKTDLSDSRFVLTQHLTSRQISTDEGYNVSALFRKVATALPGEDKAKKEGEDGNKCGAGRSE